MQARIYPLSPMKTLQILGVDCERCDLLAKRTEAAAKQLGLDYQLHRVRDIETLIELGVLMTPALIVDGEVRVVGKVPSVDQLTKLLG
jgi:small redox-active disulfide protein 2